MHNVIPDIEIDTGKPLQLSGDGLPAQAFQQILDKCLENQALAIKRLELSFHGFEKNRANDLRAIGLAIPQMGHSQDLGIVLQLIVEFDGDDINFIRQTASPFNVDSNIMVSNLNVEFVGGHRWDELGASSGIITAEESMIMGSTDTNISFAVERFNTTYSLVLDIVNVIDTSPALYNYMITEKTTRGFTVTFSSPIDTPNYKLQYAVLGDNVDYPQYNLLTSLEDQITDIDGNAITVM